MFELLAIAIALIGSSAAAVWDLKTTEIPDQIPYAMIAAGLLFHGLQSYMAWSYWPILNSCAAGLGLLGFGFLMYYLGQWGGGDAKVLSAIGFLLPMPASFPKLFFPFPISYLINVFFVGAAYMLLYATALAFLNKKILSEFSKDMKASGSMLLMGSIALFAVFFAINFYLTQLFQLQPNPAALAFNSLLPLSMTVLLFVVWKFARAVENIGFRKRVHVKKLRVGDVLLKSRLWEGITEKELRKIRKSGRRYVTIKEGVRFAPSFVLALIFTYYIGDAIFLLLKFLP